MPYVPPVDTSPRNPAGNDYGIRQLGQDAKSFGEFAGGFLRDRLNKKQYDDFLAGPNKEFANSLRGATDLLMDESNPDAAAQGVRQLQQAMTTYMDAAAQYPENPLISQRVKQTWDMNQQFMQQNLTMAHNQAAMKRQSMLDASKLQVDASTVQKNLADAAKAGTAAQAQAAHQLNLWSGDPGQYQGMSVDDKVNQIWSNVQRAPEFISKDEPRLKAYQQSLADERTQMAQEKLDEMSSRGEMKTIQPPSNQPGAMPTRRAWDAHNKEDLRDVAQTIDQDEVKARWTMNTARAEARAQGLDPSAFDKFAARVDPTKASAFRPLDRAVSEEDVGKIALGVGGWHQMYDSKTGTMPKNMEEAAERLPDSIDKLSGPLAKVFKDFPSAAKDAGLKDPMDVAKALNQYGFQAALSIFAPGIAKMGADGRMTIDRAAYDNLDAGRKANIEQVKYLINAMAGKYANEIASKMGLYKQAPARVLRERPQPLTTGFMGDVTAPLFKTIAGGYNLIKDQGR